jgi:putative membrane protein insertion efficiency factor
MALPAFARRSDRRVRRHPSGRASGIAAADAWAASLLSLPIRLYRWTLSPLLGASCRYLPTCSEYALDALRDHGALRGAWLALRRVCRCHPWGGFGHDPVPPACQQLSHRPARRC